MKKLLLLLLLTSCQSYAHRMPISFSIKQIHDPMVKVLDIDIAMDSSTLVPRGTYRLATKSGLTSKYVTFVIDGKISRFAKGFVCFYYENYDHTFDMVSSINFTRFNNTEIDFDQIEEEHDDINININIYVNQDSDSL